MVKYFGTDGIRGTCGDALINPDFAYRLGSALGHYIARDKLDLPLNVVIGRDTRLSGPELCDALIQGLNKHGVYVHDAGIVPTPAVARAVLQKSADLGIAVTASHNPATDNGIKLFNAEGCKYDESSEQQIEALVDGEPSGPDERPRPEAYPMDAAAEYINYIRSLMNQNCLGGWKIVLDLANGSTCETTPAAFRRWGAELHLIGDNPDGENINDGVGSEHPEQLGAKVREVGANIGIAHDGDGDRLVVCDEKGERLPGEVLLALFGIYALGSGALDGKTLVTTVHSNLGLDHAVRDAGGSVERVAVGDRNVARRMREIGSNIGGESSGHIILSDFATTGDGLLAAVKLIDLICKTGKPLSELRKQVTLFPQKTLNLKVMEKLPLDQLRHLSDATAAAVKQFGDDGRVLVRYSGTEPKLRLLVEGADGQVIAQQIQALECAARRDLEIIDS
ncbi:phosphoglucosamine mutase [Coraliomargarita sinensis]|uniref:Phosphoglucosamine mutase n=1 Tax=Coraliomargarita sinensis TaxID=2174842 RepID=A0A317ZGS6_9BACT|nr:phosphoglucosamine mutase [Coraliomargarita sinensis]PXA02969.1 phosphoglucosamine mutase [Coraliomargarita sinensis]